MHHDETMHTHEHTHADGQTHSHEHTHPHDHEHEHTHGCDEHTCAGCSGCGGGAEREPYVETRTFTDIVTLTSENFQTEVLDDPGLIIIDFWAEWCQPCKMMAPVFAELNGEEDKVKFCKVNVDEQPNLASMFGIDSIRRRAGPPHADRHGRCAR